MMRQVVVKFLLYNKRLFRKYSFVAVLCLVPVLVAAMRFAAAQESGMQTIAIVTEDPSDPFTREVLRSLSRYENILRFQFFDDKEEAVEALRKNGVDAVWHIPGDLQERLAEAASRSYALSVVSVVQRENSTDLNFTREILTNAIYPAFTFEVYRDYLRGHLGLDTLSEDAIKETYYGLLPEENMFEMTYLDGTKMEENSYLLAPMRGLLAVWLMLCGLVSAMYYMQDEARGLYQRAKCAGRINHAFNVQSILLLDTVVIFLLACYAAGILGNFARELVCVLLYSFCILGFCNLLRLLLKKVAWLCAWTPVLTLGMLVLSPVFVNIKEFGFLRYLFPPIYYLQSLHNTRFLWAMAVYAGAVSLICFGITKIPRPHH